MRAVTVADHVCAGDGGAAPKGIETDPKESEGFRRVRWGQKGSERTRGRAAMVGPHMALMCSEVVQKRSRVERKSTELLRARVYAIASASTVSGHLVWQDAAWFV